MFEKTTVYCLTAVYSVDKQKPTQFTPIDEIPALNISPTMAGKEFAAAKYPWKFGWCQWVIPGIITSSMSSNTFCQASPVSGTLSGINFSKYPGSTE